MDIHRIYMDNFYTSPQLLRDLYESITYECLQTERSSQKMLLASTTNHNMGGIDHSIKC